MISKRVEVRLDQETADDLADLAKTRQTTVSAVVRDAIRLLREQAARERRRLAVERLAAMEIEEMPEPDELSKQLASTYDVDLP